MTTTIICGQNIQIFCIFFCCQIKELFPILSILFVHQQKLFGFLLFKVCCFFFNITPIFSLYIHLFYLPNYGQPTNKQLNKKTSSPPVYKNKNNTQIHHKKSLKSNHLLLVLLWVIPLLLSPL